MRNTGAKALYFQYGKLIIVTVGAWKIKWSMAWRWNTLNIWWSALYWMKNLLWHRNITVHWHRLYFTKIGRKNQQYIDEPQLMAEDAEFKWLSRWWHTIMHLRETGIVGSLSDKPDRLHGGGPPELVELSLQCNLVQKDIARLAPFYTICSYAR